MENINKDNIIHISENNISPHETTSKELDTAWEEHFQSRKKVAYLTAVKLFQTVNQYIPNTHTIVIREDTSHLPAHAHIHDILSSENMSLLPPEQDWHDLGWTHEADDYVWDIYDMQGAFFVTDPSDNIRKIFITLSTE